MMQNDYQPQPYQEPRESPTEVILNNIINAVVIIFILVISFFVITLFVSMLDNQTAVEFRTYSDDFGITNPTLENVIYTSNTLLDSIVVQKYNSSNASFGGVDSADWSFNSDTSALTVNAGSLAWDITSLRITADTTYSESPHLSVLSAWALALLILAIASIFGVISYSHYKKQQQSPPYLR